MSFADFVASTKTDRLPPTILSKALAALWHDYRGEWDEAHELAQAAGGQDGSWVHAYLHRKEGDEANARYWYVRANQPPAKDSLPEEWQQIARSLLDKKS